MSQEIRKGGDVVRKVAILASVWLVATASLAFGAVAFADTKKGDDKHHKHHPKCEYEHGKWECDD